MNAAEIAAALGWPLARWPGNCYGVASGMVREGLAPGRAVYGHWLGPVSPECVIKSWRTQGLIQHGWIVTPEGTVIDPTRWVFEAAEPYIWQGEPDHYDEGGNALRFRTMGPPPPYRGLWDGETPEDGLTFPSLDSAAWTACEGLLLLDLNGGARGYLTPEQVFWLANLPPAMLGGHAAALYRTLKIENLIGIVPIDNRIAVLGN